MTIVWEVREKKRQNIWKFHFIEQLFAINQKVETHFYSALHSTIFIVIIYEISFCL